MLADLFEDTPITRILEFLIIHDSWDYTKTEIAEYSNVGWSTLNRHWEKIESLGLVKETRKIGRATLYKLNKESEVVKALMNLDREISSLSAKKIAREEVKKEELEIPVIY